METKTMDLLKNIKITPNSIERIFEDSENIEVANGYTKVVLIPKDEDFVIKIPRDDNVSYNYCERETRVYKRAVKWGIEFLFAETTRMGAIDKKKHKYYYKQVKVEDFGYRLERNDDLMDNMIILRHMEKVFKSIERSRYNDCSREWLAYVLKSYGAVVLKKLLLFLSAAKVNDLRGDNVGFKDGKPIIIDYSGYHGGCRSSS